MIHLLHLVASGAKRIPSTKDHLGSIREVVATDGTTIQAVYDYAPWGEVTKVSGAGMESDFLYTGHYRHEPSELFLTHYRAYDPAQGRWLSRDPIAENGGINLYAYVGNKPIVLVDPDGRIGIGGAIYGGIAGGIGGYMSGGWRGAFVGAGAGAAVGAINPYASHAVGGAVGAGVASLTGQAAGNLVSGKDALDRCNYDFSAAAGAAIGGALGGPLNSQISRYVAPIIRNPIGRPLGSPGLIRTPGKTIGAVVEGIVVGVGELIGAQF